MDASPAILNEDETVEALSLSNSPTAKTSPLRSDPVFAPDELFEFSSGSNDDDMSHAEDIIFCGKLIPLKQKSQDWSHDQTSDHSFSYQAGAEETIITGEEEESEKDVNNGTSRSSKRIVSSGVKYATQPNSPRSKYMRNSKSLDHQQLRRSLSSSAGFRRYSSARSSGRYDNSGEKVYKPRWYSMLFGLVSKVPPEMDLRDMKNRFVRRTPSTMFLHSDNNTILAAKRNQNKSSWGLLSVLSCKDNASIGITTSFRNMPQVNRCDNPYSRATCI